MTDRITDIAAAAKADGSLPETVTKALARIGSGARSTEDMIQALAVIQHAFGWNAMLALDAPQIRVINNALHAYRVHHASAACSAG